MKSSNFIAVTKTTFKPNVKDRILDLAKHSMDIFKKQPGLISITTHLSHDATHTMAYLVWADKKNHEDCMASPDWEGWNEMWEELIASGSIQFELNTYEVKDTYQ